MAVNPIIDESWKRVLWDQFQAPYFAELKAFLVEEKKHYQVFPPGPQIFNAFNSTPFDQVKVVIIGQDPYHGEGQAHGLCFSVQDGVPIPKSLQNLFRALSTDVGFVPPRSGNLQSWANQGVLLLNAVLTVDAHAPGSHAKKGWEKFTDSVIRAVSAKQDHAVFILWGACAIKKTPLIDTPKHLVLTSVHPSPLSASRGFFGSAPFSKTEAFFHGEWRWPE